MMGVGGACKHGFPLAVRAISGGDSILGVAVTVQKGSDGKVRSQLHVKVSSKHRPLPPTSGDGTGCTLLLLENSMHLVLPSHTSLSQV